MSAFEYFSVFISIILGLAMVHLLGGVSLMLDRRVHTRGYWVHTLWVFNMVLLIALVWIGNFLLADIDTFNVWHFLNMVAYATFIYLMSALLFPVRGAEVEDFHAHFRLNRARFFAMGLCFVATDAIDGLLEAHAVGGGLNPLQFLTLGVYATLFLIGMVWKNDRFDAFTAVVFVLGLAGFLESLVRAGVVRA